MRTRAAAPRRSTLSLLVLLLAGAQAAPAQEPGAAPGSAGHSLADDARVRSAIDMLEAWLQSRMAWVGPPGLSVAVTYREEVVWSAGLGFADVERGVPATARTVYRAASLTKPLTAIAILQLRDAGKLRLDDPVAAHLPWFAAAERAATDSTVSPIRIRDLLTHSSGIGNDGPGRHWSDFRFPAREEIRRALLAGSPPFEPGEVFKYSNWGYYLLGEIVASASGEPYADYMQHHVLDPLGMDRSTVVPAPDLPGLAIGYSRAVPGREREILPFSDVRALTPAAGLATTVNDLARLTVFLAGYATPGAELVGPVLRRGSLREMTRIQFPWMDRTGGYGLGMMVLAQPRTLIGHVCLFNGYAGAFFFDPATGIGAVAIGNASDADVLPGAHLSVLDRIFEWLTPPILAAAGVSGDGAAERDRMETARGLEGTYRSLGADLQVGVYMGELVAFNPLRPPAPGRLTRLMPLGNDRFRADVSGDEALSNGAIVQVMRDPGGAAIRMVVPGAAFDRIR